MTAVATEQTIRAVVQEVLAQIGKPNGIATNNGHSNGDWGVFDSVDDAVDAADAAFEQLKTASLEDRDEAVQIVKDMCYNRADEWGRKELDETEIGRLDHKIEKLQIIRLVRRRQRRPWPDGHGIRSVRSHRCDHARDALTADAGMQLRQHGRGWKHTGCESAPQRCPNRV